MVAGNEDVYNRVVDNGVLKEWVAIGWIDIGTATEEDKATYPTVQED